MWPYQCVVPMRTWPGSTRACPRGTAGPGGLGLKGHTRVLSLLNYLEAVIKIL